MRTIPRRRQSSILLAWLLLLALTGNALSQSSGGPYTLAQSVIAGGGGAATGGVYDLNGTLGQAGAGPATGGVYSLEGGFWNSAILGPTSLLQFSNAGYSINETGVMATITVTRAAGATALTVNYATSDGTATAGGDYSAVSGTLGFGFGVNSQTFNVPITDDALIEGNETINLTLSNPTNGAALGSPNAAVLTIVDNDSPPALEADVASRPNGNGTLSATDLAEMRRMVAGTDTPGVGPGSEFQRADCAPLNTLGNGALSATDIIQARRYVGALDAANPAGGPDGSGPIAPPASFAAARRAAPSLLPRDLSVVSQTVSGGPGAQVVASVQLTSLGDEVAGSFSVTYDPLVLSVNNDQTRIVLGSGVAPGTSLTRNVAAAGRIGIVMDSATPLTAGPRQLLTITFDILVPGPRATVIGFGDVPVLREFSNDQAQAVPASYTPGTIGLLAPSLAHVESFAARSYPGGNLVEWQTSREFANLGFNVYREQDGARVPVTPSMIAGSALFAGGQTTLTAGNSYAWQDAGGAPDSVYWVEDVDLNGTRQLHGPILATPAAGPAPNALNSPLLNGLGRASLADEGRWLKGAPAALNANSAAPLREGSDAWRRQLRLAASPAAKITVRADGWQRVTGAQLQAAGVPAVAARFLQLYLNGHELSLLVRAANGDENAPLGPADVVEFYGAGRDERESDANVYWLVAGDKPGLRVGPPARVAPGGESVGGGKPDAGSPPYSNASFPFAIERRERTLYFTALNNGEEKENFFGAVVNGDSATRSLPVAQLSADAANATLSVTLQGATYGPHRVSVALNGQELGVMAYANRENKTASFTVAASDLRAGDNAVTLQALEGSADVSVTETLRLTYQRRYAAANNRLAFTVNTRQSVTVTGFTAPGARVFDVTDPARVVQLAARVTPDASGYAVTLPGQLQGRALFALAEDAALTPASVAANEPTSWTNIQRDVDFVIISHHSLRSEAQPLATLRNAQGLNAEVITAGDIYDEWSGGVKDVRAITEFLRWTQTHWPRAPRYLLLVGDASYDPRNYLGLGDFDLTPTRYFGAQYLETSSDELLADFDGDGVGEMAVGRIPARALAETKAAFDKILYFYQPGQQTGALLVSDRPEGYDFAGLNQQARALLPNNMPVTTVNRADGSDEQARQSILQALAAGPALVNYAGHGSVGVWTGAGLLRSADAAQLGNGNRLPFFVMMTCLNGYFQDLQSEGLAEALVKAPNGGGIAAWGSSALTTPSAQAQLDAELLRQLYGGATPPRLGDAIRAAKLSVADAETRRSWILFGDPTLRIR